jgi:hypothetical protein
MRTRIVGLLVLAFAGGCASAPARFYMLAATAKAEGAPSGQSGALSAQSGAPSGQSGAPSAQFAIVVGPVSLPAEVDRPEMVVQVAPNRVALDEFNRWAAPLDDGIARAVAGNLSVLLGTPHVGTTVIANVSPIYRVTIDVQRFESVPAESVLIEAVWSVRSSVGGTPRSGRTLAREAVQAKDFDALAAAHSRALATVSVDIAAAVRAMAGTKR